MADFDPAEYGASGIAEHYDDLYVEEWHTDEAVDRLFELAAGGPVLEFGIGTGRLAIPLNQRGLDVYGVDASEEMLTGLRAKPDGAAIPVRIGDFSTVDLGLRVRLVVLAFNTIFALPDQEAQVACFLNAARHLEPGGRFVVEAWVPDVGAFRNNRLVRPRVMQAGVMSIESVVLDPVNQMMRTTQAVFRDGSVRLHPANHRYAWPSELDLMGRLAGLGREFRWSTWAGGPFSAGSPNHISVYRLEGEPRSRPPV